MPSHFWFEQQVPFLRKELDVVISSELPEWKVVTGPRAGTGGRTPDPFIGIALISNPQFAIAAGNRHSSNQGVNDCFGRSVARQDASYIGVRAYPEFGGKGANQTRGTLMDGCHWARDNRLVFVQHARELARWRDADFQWPVWRYVANPRENEEYAQEILDGLLDLIKLLLS